MEVGRIAVGVGPHEVAISPSGKIIAVANYGNKQTTGNSLSIIDLTRKVKVKDISLGEYTRPHGLEFINESEVLVTIETRQVLLKVNVISDVVTVVAKTLQPLSHMVAYASNQKIAYVANIASGTVSMIDVETNSLLQQLMFKKGIEGISIAPDGNEIWVANREDSTVTAMNTQSFEVLGTMPAHQVAYRIKHVSAGQHVVVSNGMSGNVSVYDSKTKEWVRDVNLNTSSLEDSGKVTHPIPVGIAFSDQSSFVFVSLAGYGQVAVIDTHTWQVTKSITVGDGPDGIYYSSFIVD